MDDGYEDLNVEDLKGKLRDRGLPVSGNKDELIARLRKYDTPYEEWSGADLEDELRSLDLPHSGTNAEKAARLREYEAEQGAGGDAQPGDVNVSTPDASVEPGPPPYEPPPDVPRPEAPVITSPQAQAELTGSVEVSGRADSGNTIIVEDDGQQLSLNPIPVSDGMWTVVLGLEPGPHSLSARQRNAAGDVSDPSEAVDVEVVPVPPRPQDDPDERLAHFLRYDVLDSNAQTRLTWDLYVQIRAEAQAWLEAKGL